MSEKQQIPLRLPRSLVESLDQKAGEGDISRNELAEKLLSEGLESDITAPVDISDLPPDFQPTATPKLIELKNGARVWPPPEGVPPEKFWNKVREFHNTGMPWHNASQVARTEAITNEPPNARAIAGRNIRRPLTESQRRLMRDFASRS